jgi:hypothetical protein
MAGLAEAHVYMAKELKKALAKEATKNRRSLNSEIIYRLQESLKP